MAKMKFGVRVPATGPASSAARMIDMAQEAEALGYDAIFIGDHIAPGGQNAFERHKHAPPGSGSANDPSNTLDPNQFEWVSSLSFLAGATQNIDVGVGASPLPLRDPILLAKQAATLDALSGGRFILGVGVANVTDKEEFKTLGVPFAPYKERYELAGEYVAAMKEIWENPRASFHGRHVNFDKLIIYPKPARKIPIWVGCRTLTGGVDYPPVNFAVKYADGLMWPFLPRPAEVGSMIEEFSKTARAHGRDVSGFEWCCQHRLSIGGSIDDAEEHIRWMELEQAEMAEYSGYIRPQGAQAARANIHAATIGTPSDIRKVIQGFAEVGTTYFDLHFAFRTYDALLKQLRLFAQEVMPEFS